jgi:hypothetical protein
MRVFHHFIPFILLSNLNRQATCASTIAKAALDITSTPKSPSEITRFGNEANIGLGTVNFPDYNVMNKAYQKAHPHDHMVTAHTYVFLINMNIAKIDDSQDFKNLWPATPATAHQRLVIGHVTGTYNNYDFVGTIYELRTKRVNGHKVCDFRNEVRWRATNPKEKVPIFMKITTHTLHDIDIEGKVALNLDNLKG